LTQAQHDQISTVYQVRMAGSPALWQHYNAVFFRATQGKFAAYGRDLGDSYEKNQPLRMEPPYPLAYAAFLYSDLRKRGAPRLHAAQQAAVEGSVLKPYNMRYYDFLIAHNWWTRKGKIEAVGGDTTILKTYFAAKADDDGDDADDTAANAEAANVH